MSFVECVAYCLKNRELVSEFNRLTGLHLCEHRTPIVAAIDEACGYDSNVEAMDQFMEFVLISIWLPLVNRYPEVCGSD